MIQDHAFNPTVLDPSPVNAHCGISLMSARNSTEHLVSCPTRPCRVPGSEKFYLYKQ